MADLSDVTLSLGELIGFGLYPAGATGENPSPVTGCPVLVQDGWPDPQSLKTEMPAAKALVTIYPLPQERVTTRYPRQWKASQIPPATYTLSAVGQVVTVGGQAPATYSPQNICVFVNGKPYVVQATTGQTATQVAAALQAAIVVDVAGTTVSGAAVTLPAGARLGALRVGVTGSVTQEVRRQERRFQIVIWAPTDAIRNAVAAAVDVLLAQIDFLILPDGSRNRMRYEGSPFNDFDQKQSVYRRDLLYCVEYATTVTKAATQIVATTTNLEDAQGDLISSTNA